MRSAEAPLPVIALRLLDGRSGSTLLMQLLATSPSIVFDDRYPAEYRFLSYVRRVADLMTEPFDESRHRGVTPFFFDTPPAFGPIPFRSDVLDTAELRDPLVAGMWQACSSVIRRRHPGVRYYAEKLAVPIDDALRRSVPLRVIDLVRDPRDVLCSIRSFTASGQGEDGFGGAAQTTTSEYVAAFVTRVEAQLASMREPADDHARLLLRYEDMVAGLGAVAERLGAWLGVTLDAAAVIADRAEYAHHITSSSVEASVARWKSELSAAEAELITTRLAAHLGHLGYDA